MLCCALTVFSAGAALSQAQPQQGPQPWRVVILMGSDPALPAMQQHDRTLRAALQAAAPVGVSFFTDTIDAYRFDYRDFGPEFLALQRKKYGRQRVDLVIGVGEASIEPIRDLREALWPETPVIFGAIDATQSSHERIPPEIPAAIWRVDVEGTLTLIRALQPTADRLIIVGGSSPFDPGLVKLAARAASAREGWAVEVWDQLSVEQIGQQLAGLGERTAVVYTTIARDATGRGFFPLEALAKFEAVSAAPIYGMYGTFMGRGAAAGQVVDFDTAGRQTAALAIAQLRGQRNPAGAQAEVLQASSRCVADDNKLRRYGLSPGRLPPGCEVLNTPRTLWSQHRAAVLTAAGVVALQALTIGGLLVQRRRRIVAQTEAEQRRLELARAVRFASMGELTASIAHEINQPLGAILSNTDAAEMMLRGGTVAAPALLDILADIRRDDLRAHEVIRRLRGLLEKRVTEHEPIALHPTLRDGIAILEPEARRRGMSLEVSLEAEEDRVIADPIQMQQVLLNLALNAMDAMEDQRSTLKRLSISTINAQQGIELRVADRGTGIAEGDLERVFESFYTTKPDGMGLGLPIVRAIVQAHHGSLHASRREGGGTTMTVWLPHQPPASGRPHRTPESLDLDRSVSPP